MPNPRTLLVTGASSGIGRAVSKRLLETGHCVVGVARNADRFPKHDRFSGYSIDLADLDALPAAVKELLDAHPELDAAVLCAGQGVFGGLEQQSYSAIRQLIDLNFTSQAILARALLPVFKTRTRNADRCCDLIFMGSEAALAGKRNGAIYCATKFALRGLAQALREECARSDLRVGIVHPGMVKTAFFDGLDFGPGEDPTNWVEPDDVAEAVLLMLSARQGTVLDEVQLSPLKNVVRKRNGRDN
jgi:3-hydroxy acid dehydrogenase/malonic semialdehyde reductase